MIYIFVWGNVAAKAYALLVPALAFLFVCNPLIGPIIASKITMAPSYWRVFWILQMEITIAYALTSAVLRFANRKSVELLAVLVSCVIFVVYGEFMFSKNNAMIKAENTERLPSEVLVFGKYIEESAVEDAVLIGGETFATTMRQEYCDIGLVYSRNQYLLDVYTYRGKTEEATQRQELFDYVAYDSLDRSRDSIRESLKSLNVTHIAVRSEWVGQIEFFGECGYVPVMTSGDYTLLQNR